MIFETSWDDGSTYDTKLASLLLQYGIPATFFIPIDRMLAWSDVKAIGKSFEIGGHSISHPHDLKLLTYEEKHFEIQICRDLWSSILGREIEKYCYPRGRFDQECVNLVAQAGYKEARTTEVGNYSIPNDPLRVKTTVHVYNRKEYEGKDWLSYALEIFRKNPPYFHLWGHSWEINKYDQWDNLEKFFKEVKGKV
jgi:peptidoglycan/xylan/chitin deacetylase (PgdA/CDA1 family)